jgi:predicted membrane-bound mannosyltransferase
MRGGRMGGNYRGTNRNHYAYITFGIAALYVVLALATGFAILGVIPFLMSMRSQRRHEPLAPFAIAAAVVAIIVSISVISGR